jgi:hypothetical protein
MPIQLKLCEPDLQKVMCHLNTNEILLIVIGHSIIFHLITISTFEHSLYCNQENLHCF